MIQSFNKPIKKEKKFPIKIIDELENNEVIRDFNGIYKTMIVANINVLTYGAYKKEYISKKVLYKYNICRYYLSNFYLLLSGYLTFDFLKDNLTSALNYSILYLFLNENDIFYRFFHRFLGFFLNHF